MLQYIDLSLLEPGKNYFFFFLANIETFSLFTLLKLSLHNGQIRLLLPYIIIKWHVFWDSKIKQKKLYLST